MPSSSPNSARSLACTPEPPRSVGLPAPLLQRSAPEAPQPGGGRRVVPVGGSRPDHGLLLVGTGVAAQEHDVGADPVEAHQGLGEAGVVEVTLRVDREAVVAEGPLSGPRLDPAQIDAPA